MLKPVCICFLLCLQKWTCHAQKCPPLPMLEHGEYVKISERKVRVECHPSYEYENPEYPGRKDPTVKCKDGKWDDPEPSCDKLGQHCSPPGEIENGKLTRSDPPYEANEEVHYGCDDGYEIVGSDILTCKKSDYQWSDHPPECRKKRPPLIVLTSEVKKHLVDKLKTFNDGRVIAHDVEYLGLDLFLALDKSSSISPSQFMKAIKFAKFLTEQFNVSNGNIHKVGGTRLAVHSFGDFQKEELSLDDKTIDSTKAALAELDTIKCLQLCDGGTNMAAALARIEYLSKNTRPQAKKVLFVTSDGVPTVGGNLKSVLAYALSLKNKGFEIYTVGIGEDINENLLKELSSTPVKEHMFLLKDFDDFTEIMGLIRNGTVEAPPPSKEKCGYIAEKFYETRKLEKNGPLKLGHWPSLVAVIVRDFASSGSRFACNGVLICQNWVLTTAQCLINIKTKERYEPRDVYVVLGDEDFEKTNPNEQLFYAVNIIIHPKFVQNKTMIRDDIALIQLNEKAELNDYVRTACIVDYSKDYSSRPGETAYMVGWLITNEEQARIPVEAVKEFKAQQVKMKINGEDACELNKPEQYKCDESRLLSANAENEPSKVCKGEDRGAPLFVPDQTDVTGKRMAVSGIASYVESCTLDSKVAFFTHISIYYDWIRESVGFCTDDYDDNE